ncbi:MAG TPA: hypothetical protein PKY05_10905, partial [Fibrobacteria bacterium]|nr:hypothetical protein [Fibrobacteria bacterium]
KPLSVVPVVPLLQGGATRIQLTGWDGRAGLDLSWKGDVVLLVPCKGESDSMGGVRCRLEVGSTALARVRDSGLWAHGSPSDSLRHGGRYSIGVQVQGSQMPAPHSQWQGMSRRWPVRLDLLESADPQEDDQAVFELPREKGRRWGLHGARGKTIGSGDPDLVRLAVAKWKLRDSAVAIEGMDAKGVVAKISVEELMRMRFGRPQTDVVGVDTTAVSVSDSQTDLAQEEPSDLPERPFRSIGWQDSLDWHLNVMVTIDSADMVRGHALTDSVNIRIRPREAFRTLWEASIEGMKGWMDRPKVAWSGRVQVRARHRIPGGGYVQLADTSVRVDSAQPELPVWQGTVGGLRTTGHTKNDTGWEVSVRVVDPDTASEWVLIPFTVGGGARIAMDPIVDQNVVWKPLKLVWMPDSQSVRGDWEVSGLPLYGGAYLVTTYVRLIHHDAVARVERRGTERAVGLEVPHGGWFSAQECYEPEGADQDYTTCRLIDTFWTRQGIVQVRFAAGAIEGPEAGGIRVREATMEDGGGSWAGGPEAADSPWRYRRAIVASGPFRVTAKGIPEDLASGDGFRMGLRRGIGFSVPVHLLGRMETSRREERDTVHWTYRMFGLSGASSPKVRVRLNAVIPNQYLQDLEVTGSVEQLVEFRQSSPLVGDPEHFLLETADLEPLHQPWHVRMDSAVHWSLDPTWTGRKPQDNWGFRVLGASVGPQGVSVDRFDLHLPVGLLDSTQDRWIQGFSPWRVEQVIPRYPAKVEPTPRCTTSRSFASRLGNGWILSAKGWELVQDTASNDHSGDDSYPSKVSGIRVLQPASLTLNGTSILDLDKPRRPGSTVKLELDSFRVGFDDDISFRAVRAKRSDTVGKLILAGSIVLENNRSMVVRDGTIKLLDGWIAGRAKSITFATPLMAWGGSLELVALHARLPLQESDRIPVEGGHIAGTGLVLEQGLEPVLRVESPRFIPSSKDKNCSQTIALQEAILTLEGSVVLLSGATSDCEAHVNNLAPWTPTVR